MQLKYVNICNINILFMWQLKIKGSLHLKNIVALNLFLPNNFRSGTASQTMHPANLTSVALSKCGTLCWLSSFYLAGDDSFFYEKVYYQTSILIIFFSIRNFSLIKFSTKLNVFRFLKYLHS